MFIEDDKMYKVTKYNQLIQQNIVYSVNIIALNIPSTLHFIFHQKETEIMHDSVEWIQRSS